jgi:lipid II:glycine glycyltransferase (peptidoglycan interpeptide bridge formation enzyme)
MVELGGEYFRVADLTAHGYKTHTTHTYRVDLSGGASEVWKNLKPAMRNKIHKAEKSGVDVTHDTSCEFSGRFFDMLQSVFKRQGLTPTYGLSRVETVISTLSDSGNVVPLTAWREGEPLACVILLVDASAAYYWGGASYETAYPFGANDIIHWHAFQLAIERGLSVYDTCGGGDYKKKFGGRLVDTPAGYLSVNQAFTAVRMAVRGVIRSRSVMAGRAKHLRRKFR